MEERPLMVSVESVSHAYGKRRSLKRIDLAIHRGEIISLMGPSGCGKTTLLKLVAGKIRPRKGKMKADGKPVSRRQRKHWQGVFHDTLLIEWLRIGVQFSLLLAWHGIRGVSAQDLIEKVLHVVDMADCGRLFPDQLSEGEYQRVLIARALLLRPEFLIMDDPFSRLDRLTRETIWKRLKKWQSINDMTILYASSLPEEALNEAHQTVLMREGRIVQQGAAQLMLQAPESHFAAAFLKQCNQLAGVITGFGSNKAALEMDGLILPCIPHRSISLGDKMVLCVDWDALHYSLRPQGEIFVSGVLRAYSQASGGRLALIELHGGEQMRAYCRQEEECPLGSRVFLWWDLEKAYLLPLDESLCSR